MNVDFVPFELAKKLKEEGFREQCLAHYGNTGGFYLNVIDTYERPNQELDYIDFLNCFNTGNSIELIDAPTISQVLKWLRDEKNIHLVVDIEPKGYFFNVNYNIIKSLSGRYEFDFYNSWNCYSDDKQATLAGIEYVLDNLI